MTAVPVKKVNVDRVNYLIKVLKDGELAAKGIGFNMGPWIARQQDGFYDRSGHYCGTVACLGGTIDLIQLFDKRQDALEAIDRQQLNSQGLGSVAAILNEGAYEGEGPYVRPAVWLGLDKDEEAADTNLFQPELATWSEIRMETAIRCLEILRDELVIDWERAATECGQSSLIY